MIYARCCCYGCCVCRWAHRLPSKPSFLIVPKRIATQKAPASLRARGETPIMSFELGANCEGRERVEGKASRIQSSRIGSVLVCVRQNAQPRELKLLESTRFVLNTVDMIAVYPQMNPPVASYTLLPSRLKHTITRKSSSRP